MKRFMQIYFALCLALVAIGPPSAKAQDSSIGRTIGVPIDRGTPELGSAQLYYELGYPYDPVKPTLFVIVDGQEFYLRRGTVKALQDSLFGGGFNVVGIPGRGADDTFAKACQDANGKTDWAKAWRVFNSSEWIEDIEAVRRAVVGQNDNILLYGSSGGANLVHEYLAKYGAHVTRVFTEAAGSPFLNRELRIGLDTFWKETEAFDPKLLDELRTGLDKFSGDRLEILLTLQRQHFFLPPEKLMPARAELIRALANGDRISYEKLQKQYQVPDIVGLYSSTRGISITVREFELIYPTGGFDLVGNEKIYPYLESQLHFCKPLVELIANKTISPPAFDMRGLHKLDAEVFVFNGRWDEAVDYRCAIALAFLYPNHELFLADDSHNLSSNQYARARNQLMRIFLTSGSRSDDFQSAMRELEPYRWKE